MELRENKSEPERVCDVGSSLEKKCSQEYTFILFNFNSIIHQTWCDRIAIDLDHAVAILVMFTVSKMLTLIAHGTRLLFRPASVWLH